MLLFLNSKSFAKYQTLNCLIERIHKNLMQCADKSIVLFVNESWAKLSTTNWENNMTPFRWFENRNNVAKISDIRASDFWVTIEWQCNNLGMPTVWIQIGTCANTLRSRCNHTHEGAFLKQQINANETKLVYSALKIDTFWKMKLIQLKFSCRINWNRGTTSSKLTCNMNTLGKWKSQRFCS